MHLYFVSLRLEGPGSKCVYTAGHPLVKDFNQGTSCNVTFIRGGEEQRSDGLETGCRQSFLRSFVVMRTREMGWVESGVVGGLQRVCFRGALESTFAQGAGGPGVLDEQSAWREATGGQALGGRHFLLEKCGECRRRMGPV